MQYAYVTVDVFTERAFGGNQLALLPDARGLSDAAMLAVTREFGYSESVFVLPPENAENHKRLRIFTPAGEVPFAGHPTVGAAFALAELGVLGENTSLVRFEEGIGTILVSISRTGDHVTFTELTAAQLPEGRAAEATSDQIAEMLSISASAIRSTASLPAAYSCGVPFLYVPLDSVETLSGIELRRDAVARALRGTWAEAVLAFAQESPGVLRARMFAPLHGIDEDAATGSAAGALSGALLSGGPFSRLGGKPSKSGNGGPVDGTHRWTVVQGVEMGRPSTISVAAEVTEGRITQVRVGGPSVLVAQGTIEIPQ